jgi:hypothetical protein
MDIQSWVSPPEGAGPFFWDFVSWSTLAVGVFFKIVRIHVP